MNLHESGEMYLETIYVLSKKIGVVRSIDISEYMNYSKPSVSRALSILKKNGLVLVDSEGHLTLSNEGLSIAIKIYNRHLLLNEFLQYIGVDKETATNDACKMEHAISDQSYVAIQNHLNLLKEK